MPLIDGFLRSAHSWDDNLRGIWVWPFETSGASSSSELFSKPLRVGRGWQEPEGTSPAEDIMFLEAVLILEDGLCSFRLLREAMSVFRGTPQIQNTSKHVLAPKILSFSSSPQPGFPDVRGLKLAQHSLHALPELRRRCQPSSSLVPTYVVRSRSDKRFGCFEWDTFSDNSGPSRLISKPFDFMCVLIIPIIPTTFQSPEVQVLLKEIWSLGDPNFRISWTLFTCAVGVPWQRWLAANSFL